MPPAAAGGALGAGGAGVVGVCCFEDPLLLAAAACLAGAGCLAECAVALAGWPPFCPGAGVLSLDPDLEIVCWLPSAGLFLAWVSNKHGKENYTIKIT